MAVEAVNKHAAGINRVATAVRRRLAWFKNDLSFIVLFSL
jgi:hypothetical protein